MPVLVLYSKVLFVLINVMQYDLSCLIQSRCIDLDNGTRQCMAFGFKMKNTSVFPVVTHDEVN